jgi:hypothetical protein
MYLNEQNDGLETIVRADSSHLDLLGIINGVICLPEKLPRLEDESSIYKSIDTYVIGTTVLYSSGKPLNPIGFQGSGFQTGSRGNIRQDLGDGLQERYDFSGHNETTPHINYDLLGASKRFNEISLGENHALDLGAIFGDLK